MPKLDYVKCQTVFQVLHVDQSNFIFKGDGNIIFDWSILEMRSVTGYWASSQHRIEKFSNRFLQKFRQLWPGRFSARFNSAEANRYRIGKNQLEPNLILVFLKELTPNRFRNNRVISCSSLLSTIYANLERKDAVNFGTFNSVTITVDRMVAVGACWGWLQCLLIDCLVGSRFHSLINIDSIPVKVNLYLRLFLPNTSTFFVKSCFQVMFWLSIHKTPLGGQKRQNAWWH